METPTASESGRIVAEPSEAKPPASVGPLVAVVMGVSGSGKTTVGRALAHDVRWKFFDADDFHSEDSLRKMEAGMPLNDEDRTPWLHQLRGVIERTVSIGDSAVLACSSLKDSYRTILRDGLPVTFVYLRVAVSVLRERMRTRSAHFFAPELLDSQLATLEEPTDAVVVDGARPVADLVAEIRRALDR
jgi:gluconokinase